mgnify:CR=1 FL=1
MIYIGMFVVTILCTYIAERTEKKEKKIVFVFFSILSILVPSILAGIRTLDIGIDLQVYVEKIFLLATRCNTFKEYFEVCNTDFLYMVVNYLVSRFTNNINWLLFVFELINMSLAYLFIYNNRKTNPMWLSMAVYLFLFYNISLNLVRQGLAISVILFSMRYVENRKFIKFLICIVVATLFHSTAVFTIPVYFIFNIIENAKHKKIYKFLIVSVITIAVLNYENIIKFLIYDLRILSVKYINYITIYSREEIDFNYAFTLFRLFWIIISMICYKNLKNANEKNESYIFLLIIDLILNQIGMFSKYADRIAYYYGLPALIYMIPILYKGFKNNSLNKFIVYLGILLMLIFYWWFIFIHFKTGETYPFYSIFSMYR